jgi:hypothetical protein
MLLRRIFLEILAAVACAATAASSTTPLAAVEAKTLHITVGPDLAIELSAK